MIFWAIEIVYSILRVIPLNSVRNTKLEKVSWHEWIYYIPGGTSLFLLSFFRNSLKTSHDTNTISEGALLFLVFFVNCPKTSFITIFKGQQNKFFTLLNLITFLRVDWEGFEILTICHQKNFSESILKFFFVFSQSLMFIFHYLNLR